MLRRAIVAVVSLSLITCTFRAQNVNLATVSIGLTLQGASPETMANTVALPLERQIETISGIRSITSASRRGETLITIQFDPGRNVDAMATELQSDVVKVAPQLPPDVSPTFRIGNPADAPVVFVALSSETLPLIEVSEFAQSRIASRIPMIPGVARVQVFGAANSAVRVQLDPDKLAAYGIEIDQVEAALKNSIGDLQMVVVGMRNGSPVRMSDIARVTRGGGSGAEASWFNDRRAVILAVQQLPGSSAARMAAEIRNMIQSSGANPGISIATVENLPGDSNFVIGSMEFPQGVSNAQMIQQQQQANGILSKDPNVDLVISVLGAQVFVRLKPPPKGKLSVTEDVIEQLRRKLAAISGILVHLRNPMKSQSRYALTSASFDDLITWGQKAGEKLRSTPGVLDVVSDLRMSAPYMTLNVDRAKARAMGITTTQVEKAFAVAYGGLKIGGEHPVVIELDPQYRDSPIAFSKLSIKGVRLDSVASIAMTTGPETVNHTGLLPSVTITFDARLGTAVEKAIASLQLPPGVKGSLQSK